MKKRYLLLCSLFILAIGYWIPEQPQIPVQNAHTADWHPKSFWYYPWGRSGVHKGIDIFARKHTPVLAATNGLVVSTGYNSMGGNTVLILGAKWRFHYYAHLQTVDAQPFQWVQAGNRLGSVGDSGNAKGKPPHLHYSIMNLIPDPRRIEPNSRQGWRKMFYIDPHHYLTGQRHG